METSEIPYIPHIDLAKQNSISELSKKLTGLEIDDPKILEKIANDSEKVGEKYSLPFISQLVNKPDTYLENLKTVLKNEDIPLYRVNSEHPFFKENNTSVAAYFPDTKSILVNEDNYINNSSDVATKILLIDITHEVIHAMQYKYDSNLPIEQKEYEAYVGSSPFDLSIKEGKIKDIKPLFESIKNSVDVYKKQKN